MFSVEVRPTGVAWVLELRGELDFESAAQLREAADVLFEAEQPALLVVDCAALGFCDSSGINVLIRIYQRLSERGGVLRLAAVPGSVTRVFALTGLNQVMAVYETADEALSVQDGARALRGPDTSAGPLDDEKAVG
ncbi:STAS domain-containing protein [Streptacidiphilus sp. N1-12]|uniref:STAS domain-containing protein n=2 Tax=Streptacidiphilus alkalitolerans TaxID=3342712 RepID=A0ABV6W8T5_9ACTN